MNTKHLFFCSKWMTALQKPVAVLMTLGLLVSPVAAQPPLPVPGDAAQPPPPAQDIIVPRSGGGEKELQLNFRDSPLDQVLDLIADLTNRTIIKSPGVNATITLKSQTRLKVSEAMIAIEAVLSMNNITLVPMGDKFLKAVQTAQARQEGMPISIGTPESGFSETEKLVSQVFTLKHIDLVEIQPIIQSLLHGYGKIQPLERANSLMVTDTEGNLARVTEVLEFLDQPVASLVETRIYEIRFAKASEIASKLNELIADSQAKEEKPQIAVAEGQPAIPAPPGVIRARQAPPAQAGSEVDAAMQMAERGVIRGKVKIIADDRTNILFVISRTENFSFFDKIVNVLDRQIDPAITVRVVALEYAKAEEISGILNEFIGAASAENEAGAPKLPSDTGGTATPTDNRSQALRDFIRARTEQPTAAAETTADNQSAIGRLSPDTKILADKRTNSLLLMGKLSDLNILDELIDQLDIMLAQVVIEAVIIEVTLGDDVRSGVSWLQRSMVAYSEENVGPGGGITVREPVAAWAGGTSLGVGELRDAATLGKPEDGEFSLIPGGLTYFASIYDLNIDAVIRLAQSSRDAEILSTPIIVTTDNTEAKIIASTQRPVVNTTDTTDGGNIRSSYEYRDIGINLTVTPRINPQRMVIMEVSQTADDVAGEIEIDGNLVPEITKRELTATVAVEDRSTIVLGGLILSRNAVTETKVPILGDIPIIGFFFKLKAKTVQRAELVVLLTPYVLMTPAEARAESTRLYSANSSKQRQFHHGWSDSEFGRMTDSQKEEYLKNWEKNRPEPYTRDLTRDIMQDEKVADTNQPPVTKSKKKQPRSTLVGMVKPKDELANPEESIELSPEQPVPTVSEDGSIMIEAPEEDKQEVQPEPVAQPQPEGETSAAPSEPESDVDYNKPIKIR